MGSRSRIVRRQARIDTVIIITRAAVLGISRAGVGVVVDGDEVECVRTIASVYQLGCLGQQRPMPSSDFSTRKSPV